MPAPKAKLATHILLKVPFLYKDTQAKIETPKDDDKPKTNPTVLLPKMKSPIFDN